MVSNYDTPIRTSRDGKLFEPAEDHSFVGDRYIHGTAGEGLTIMNVCALQSDGGWDQADADVEAETDALIAIACATVNGADTVNLVLAPAIVRDNTLALTIGAPIYISNTPGGIVQTAPAGVGDFVRKIGYALTADTWLFEGYGAVVVVPA